MSKQLVIGIKNTWYCSIGKTYYIEECGIDSYMIYSLEGKVLNMISNPTDIVSNKLPNGLILLSEYRDIQLKKLLDE